MKNDPAALAVACVTRIFEGKQAGESLVELSVGLRQVLDGLDLAETRGIVASLSAMTSQLLPEEPDEARKMLQSMGHWFASEG